MLERLSRPLFADGVHQYSWCDVLLASAGQAELRSQLDETDRALAVLGASESKPSFTGADVTTAVKTFRQARKLLTAEEVERWLNRWSLSQQEWVASLTRSVAQRHFRSSHRGNVPEAQIDAALLPDLLCSGRLDKLGAWFAGRVALASEGDSAKAKSELVPNASVVRALRLTSEQVAERALRLGALLSTAEAIAAKAISEGLLAGQVAAHRLEWTWVRWRELSFDKRPAADEAAMCVRVDGMSLEQVAADAGRAVADKESFVETAPEWLRGPMLSATEGELLGPIPAGSSHVLLVLSAKEPADLGSARVRTRAEQSAMTRIVGDAMARKIRWIPEE